MGLSFDYTHDRFGAGFSLRYEGLGWAKWVQRSLFWAFKWRGFGVLGGFSTQDDVKFGRRIPTGQDDYMIEGVKEWQLRLCKII